MSKVTHSFGTRKSFQYIIHLFTVAYPSFITSKGPTSGISARLSLNRGVAREVTFEVDDANFITGLDYY